MIQKWMAECQSDHDSCLKPKVMPLPNRVIDVTPTDPVLVETKGQIGTYITLSHRWGTPAAFMTTEDNLSTHLVGMPWDTIPRNFQDAITFTRKLGMRYLWIDSICIVQNVSTMLEEMVLMSNIYSFAVLNISATTSPNCFAGFLHPREPIAIFDDKYLAPARYPWKVEIDQSVTNSRAWVLQERLLSQRIVHFARQQIFWECQTTVHAESGDDQANSDGFKRVLKDVGLPHGLNQNAGIFSDETKEGLHKRWYWLIEQYTMRGMSVFTDKLPAISALAREFSSKIKGEYKAGLFDNDLERGLLWYVTDPGKTIRPCTYRAPSWSWASLDAIVTVDPGWSCEQTFVSIVECKTSLKAGHDAFGEVESGFVSVSGPVEEFSSYTALKQFMSATYMDDADPEENATYLSMMVSSWTRDRDEELFDVRQYGYLPTIYQTTWGLVLRPTGRENEFVRAGIVMIPNIQSDPDDVHGTLKGHTRAKTVTII
jgi:hypothetical protein